MMENFYCCIAGTITEYETVTAIAVTVSALNSINSYVIIVFEFYQFVLHGIIQNFFYIRVR